MKKFTVITIVSALFLISFLIVTACKIQARELYTSDNEVIMNDAKQVRASHILVSTQDEAEKIRQEVLNGEDFGKLAAEYFF